MTTQTIRTKRQFFSTQCFARHIYDGSPSPWTRYGGDVYTLDDSIVYEPYEFPAHRHEIRSGRSATTKMVGIRYELPKGSVDRFCTGTVKFAGKSPYPPSVQTFQTQGFFGPGNLPLETEVDALVNSVNTQALMTLNSQVLKAKQHFRGLVFAGELAEAIHMIRNPAKALYRGCFRYLDALKKRASGKRLQSKVLRHVVADTWLEYVYGWAPLINDVRSGAEALARASFMRTAIPLHAYAESSVAIPLSYGGITVDHGFLHEKLNSPFRKTTVSVSYIGQMSDNPSDYSLPKLFGLDWRSIVPAVWELIPYSFLVDYFTNIGAIISAYSTGRGGVAWLQKTVRSTVFDTLTTQYFLTNLNQNYYPDGALYRWVDVSLDSGSYEGIKIHRVSRDRFDTDIVPPFSVTFPFSSTRWLNMAALLATRDRVARSIR